MKTLLLSIVLAIASLTIAFSVKAADLDSGAKVFNANCAACHLGGNNVIIASKGLKKEALKKYSMDSQEAIVAQVTKGKNAMPAFAGRLKASQIEDVAAFVLQQSEKGW